MRSAVRCDQQPEKTSACPQTLQYQTTSYIPRAKRVCRETNPEINRHLRGPCELQHISLHVLRTHFAVQFIHLIHVLLLILWRLLAIPSLLPYKVSFSSPGAYKLPPAKAQDGSAIVSDSAAFVKLAGAEPDSRSRIKSTKKSENPIKKHLQKQEIDTPFITIPSVTYIHTYIYAFSIIISSHLLSRSSPPFL